MVKNREIVSESEILDTRLHLSELRRVDPIKVIEKCREGATLIFDGVDSFDDSIRKLVNHLEFEIGEKVHTNLYCSWEGHQGFDIHYDTHEVFLLQISGKKSWKVYNPVKEFPLHLQKADTSKMPDENEYYLFDELKQGDILFIPRGHYHYGVAVSEPSIHLTIGITCKTGISLIEWLREELRDDVIWRKDIPLPFMQNFKLDDAVEKIRPWMIDLIGNLNSKVNSDDGIRDFIKYLFSKERPESFFNLPYQVVDIDQELSVDTQFRRSIFQKPIIIEHKNEIEIILDGKKFNFNIDLQNWLDKLFSKHSFDGAEMVNWGNDLEWEDILPLVRFLIKENVISFY